MKAKSSLLKASFISAVLGCALALPFALPSSAQTDSRGLNIVNIRAEDGKEIKLYDKSYALVIGVSDYTAGWPKLPGVKKDIEEVARALERQGFQVTKVENPDSAQLDKAFKEFIDLYGINVENRLLFYFAGHGHTVKQSYGDEMGYIVPADAPNPLRDQPGFMSKAMDMQQMELYARRIQSKHALFVFDSCFSGSIFALSRAVPESIGYKTARPVRQFITSGSADEQVPDKSIFREQFIAAIAGEADTNHDGYVTGTELGEFLQDKVVNYSRNTQHPQYGKIRNPNLDKGDFVFALPKAMKAQPPTVAANTNPTPARPATPSPVDPVAVELAFWDSIKNSTDAEDFKDYLTRYPNGQFASIARRRVAALTNVAKPTPVRPVPATPLVGNAEANTMTNTRPAASAAGMPALPAGLSPNALRSYDFTTVTLDGKGKLKNRSTQSAVYYVEDLGGARVEMVAIPGGTFQMGSSDADVQAAFADEKRYNGDAKLELFSSETPRHQVSVRGFYMSKYEVTQAQYKAIMGTNPSDFKGDDLPVESVSWNDAVEFCKRLSAKTGREYRLPTEAEWEYAARAGTTTPFAFGDTVTPEIVNYNGEYPYSNAAKGTMRQKTTPIGSMGAANGFGLYDMHGNVLEWCLDYWHENYNGLASSAPTDGSAWLSGGDSTKRVLRGGSWDSGANNCRSATRGGNEPDYRIDAIGFRVVAVARQ